MRAEGADNKSVVDKEGGMDGIARTPVLTMAVTRLRSLSSGLHRTKGQLNHPILSSEEGTKSWCKFTTNSWRTGSRRYSSEPRVYTVARIHCASC